MAGCGTVRGIQQYCNHIHSMKYAEVINANSAANWAEIHVVNDMCMHGHHAVSHTFQV